MNEENENDPKAPVPQPGPELNPYDLAPTPTPANAKPAEPAASLDAGRLLDTFDDDTDFSDDGMSGKKPPVAASDDDVTPAGLRPEPFVLPGRGEATIIAAVGGGVTVAAMVITAVLAPAGKFPLAINAGLMVVLQTLTGIASLGIAAHLAGRPLGSVSLGAARMLLAVAGFVFMASLQIPLYGRFDEAALAIAAYVGVLFLTGRRPIQDWLPVFGSHVLLAVALWAAFSIHTWASAAGAVKVAP